MEEKRNGWDIFFIALSGLLGVLLLVIIIMPLTQGFNPFKLMFGNVSEYNFIEALEYRNSNILDGLLGETPPNLYPLELNEKDHFEYLDERKKKPSFKDCNTYELFIEAYNEPRFSKNGIEIYGPYGVGFVLPSSDENEEVAQIIASLETEYPQFILAPYFVADYEKEVYISALDLSGSVITLERFDGEKYTTLVSVSGSTWKIVCEENEGTAILRNLDGSLFFDSGDYRLTIMLKQVLIQTVNEDTVLKVKTPKTVVYHFKVNDHECANGVLIANNASQNTDFQLNIVNDESVVCYAPQSYVSVGDMLSIGVSISEDRLRKLSWPNNMGLQMSLCVYIYDPVEDVYVLIENREIMNAFISWMNQTFDFEGEAYRTGKYKIVMNYDSWLEHIEQEYEYYFVFEN